MRYRKLRIEWLLPMVILFLVGCARQPNENRPAPPEGKHLIASEDDAIDVVCREIQRSGDDPKLEECSARKTDEGWRVTAWHIHYPENVGSSRFVPGGFTIYSVGNDGKILDIEGGL